MNSSTAALEYMRKARTVFCPDFLAQSSIDSAYVRRKEIQDVWKSVNTVPLFTWKNDKTRVCLYQRQHKGEWKADIFSYLYGDVPSR